MVVGITVNLHYSRAGRRMSWRGVCKSLARLLVLLAAGAVALPLARAQYAGQVDKKNTQEPQLRAVGVLEWTGDLGKPKTSRLVPITVYDGQALQDGGVYLARPQPMAIADGVEYILQKNGDRIGLFDIDGAGQQMGSWVGFGSWKPMPKPKVVAEPLDARVDQDDTASDRPTLHRKHGSGDAKGGSGSDDGKSGSNPGSQAPAPDPDRPTLHKKTEDTGNAGAGTGSSAGSDSSGSSSPASDPDRPTLHKAPETSSTSDPSLKKGKAKTADEGHVEDLPDVTDPDRPRLMRGKSNGGGSVMTPTLMGMPSDMGQVVAVSDAANRPEHPWSYSWADPADELKMKAALEDAARIALGIQPAPTAKPKATRTTQTAKAKTRMILPPTPAPLADEQFRVFELAYGSGATLVLTAHTDGPPAQQKYVTLIAQPDLYGSLVVLLKSVTDGAHLDDTPRMRLVDAVDALADNRGELLFELRGATERQFALYRVLRGTAEKLFVSGGGSFGSQAMN
jgi:hypothetical protein